MSDSDLLDYVERPLPGTGDHGRPKTQYTYWENGLTKVETDTLNRTVAYTYDELGRVASVTDLEGSVVSQYTTDTDPVFGTVRKTVTTDKFTGVTVEIVDPLGRLIEHRDPDPGTGQHTAPITKYTYDVYGNRKTVQDSSGQITAYEYDALNHLYLTTRPDPDGPTGPLPSPVTQYAFDAAGNLTRSADITDPAYPRETLYEYDALNRRTRELGPS